MDGPNVWIRRQVDTGPHQGAGGVGMVAYVIVVLCITSHHLTRTCSSSPLHSRSTSAYCRLQYGTSRTMHNTFYHPEPVLPRSRTCLPGTTTTSEDALGHTEARTHRPTPTGLHSGGMDTPIALSALDFESHFRRASLVLDGLSAANPDDGSPEYMVTRFETSASFTVGRDLKVGAANTPAASALGLKPGTKLTDLPLETDDREALAERITRILASNRDEPALFRARLKDQPRLILFQLRAMQSFLDSLFLTLLIPGVFKTELEIVRWADLNPQWVEIGYHQ